MSPSGCRPESIVYWPWGFAPRSSLSRRREVSVGVWSPSGQTPMSTPTGPVRTREEASAGLPPGTRRAPGRQGGAGRPARPGGAGRDRAAGPSTTGPPGARGCLRRRPGCARGTARQGEPADVPRRRPGRGPCNGSPLSAGRAILPLPSGVRREQVGGQRAYGDDLFRPSGRGRWGTIVQQRSAGAWRASAGAIRATCGGRTLGERTIPRPGGARPGELAGST